MKYKVGNKVRIKSKEWYDKNKDESGYVDGDYKDCTFIPDMASFLGKTSVITRINDDGYSLKLDNGTYKWNDYMIEGLATEQPAEPTLFDRIKSAIIEAGKQAPIIIEQTEDGGIKISPIEEKPQPRESGIYIDPELPHVHVIFGGKIHVGVGECKAENGYTIGLQELEELKECGGRHDEEWVKEKPTVNLIINNKNTVKILRDALNIIDNKLNKED